MKQRRAVGAVEFREQVILHLAIFAGLRPGEMLAVQRRHVAKDRNSVEIEQRVYRGEIDDPKNGESRPVAVPPRTADLLTEWLDTAVDPNPEHGCSRRRTEGAALAGQPAPSPCPALLEEGWLGVGGL